MIYEGFSLATTTKTSGLTKRECEEDNIIDWVRSHSFRTYGQPYSRLMLYIQPCRCKYWNLKHGLDMQQASTQPESQSISAQASTADPSSQTTPATQVQPAASSTRPNSIDWELSPTLSLARFHYLVDPRRYSAAPGFAAIDLAKELGPRYMDEQVIEYLASRIWDVFTICNVWDARFTNTSAQTLRRGSRPDAEANASQQGEQSVESEPARLVVLRPAYWVEETTWFTLHGVFAPPNWWEGAVSDRFAMEKLIRQLGPPPWHRVPLS